jgi:hypothetical protein
LRVRSKLEEATTTPNGRYTAHVHFREDRVLVAVAHARAEAQGTQLASVLRGLLRDWLKRDTIYKEDTC